VSSESEKDRSRVRFANIVLAAAQGPGGLSYVDMCKIVLRAWQMAATEEDVRTGNSPDVTIIRGCTDPSGKACVVEQWGPMLSTLPPALAAAKGMAYFQAAEHAVTDEAISVYFSQVECGNELSQHLKKHISEHRRKFLAMSADVQESEDIIAAMSAGVTGARADGGADVAGQGGPAEA
jgi:hypothetical protein